MYEEMNQTISRLIDGDLNYDETQALLKNIQTDEALNAKMCRYQAISEALKTDSFYQVSPDFSRRISQKIKLEPNYLVPQHKLQSPKETRQIDNKRFKLFAIAASTLTVAVLVGQNLQMEGTSSKAKTVNTVAIPSQSLPHPIAIAHLEKPQPHKGKPLNAQFNAYLQAHNSSIYTNGEANFHPYATTASFGQH